jgi:ABC-type nitrate/sulfonate/bicarbonate transport system permease component
MSDTPQGRKALVASYLLSTLSVAFILIAWEMAGRAKLVPDLFLPSVSAVFFALRGGVVDGSLLLDLGISLYRAFAGLLIASVVGVGLGITMARSTFVRWFFDPFISLAFPAPKIAFLPIFVLWFGIDHLSKILLVAFSAVFPITIATYSAAISVNHLLIWSSLSLGSSRPMTMWRVILPACYPRIFAAFRVAVPVALITAFTAEMVAGGGGMGATLMYSQRFFESPTVFAYIVSMLLVGLLFDKIMLLIRDRFPSWRESN